MALLFYSATLIFAALIVFGPHFFMKKTLILKNKNQYYDALEQLEKDSNNEELKLEAWELGREFYGSARITGKATNFDEAIIKCQITASCETNEIEIQFYPSNSERV
ncbi:hypothetical protein [Neobacillus terrae]|uniref:hypothetical protein n=1 Tax=Neobacillus terrae TaxID=3034837 RepID=UPI001409AB35|nr:hypothetical protein [Neobacillus terrae]NHM31389.1 hypothetical protein [Neobacillus terrae]